MGYSVEDFFEEHMLGATGYDDFIARFRTADTDMRVDGRRKQLIHALLRALDPSEDPYQGLRDLLVEPAAFDVTTAFLLVQEEGSSGTRTLGELPPQYTLILKGVDHDN